MRYPVDEPGRGSFPRALLFGTGGALAGLVLYATFAIVTGWIIGFVALGVGYIVGKAVLMGSRGVGGRGFQVTAVALTYAAVSLAAVPIALSQWDVEASSIEAAAPDDAPAVASDIALVVGPDGTRPSPIESGDDEISLGAAVGMPILLGLASPFLELTASVSGLIGLLILFFGLQIAWNMTAASAATIEGPFSVGDADQPAG